MPGSKHFIEVEVLVDEASAAALTYGRDKLEEILILHLENGLSYRVICMLKKLSAQE